MPARKPHELAERLSRKAGQDALAMRELAPNSEIDDSIVGFHAQQAVEKWLKAVMAERGLAQAKTHDLNRLAALLESDGAELPASRSRLDQLTQYSVPLRYEDLLDAEPLDRDSTLALLDACELWATQQLESRQAH